MKTAGNKARATCSRCGAPLAGDELAGNCPRCLSTLILSPETPEPAGTSPGPILRRLGDYELLEEVARGGMGVVFRARQVSLGREVAVKVLRDAWLATPVQVKRFRAEAANAAKLKHANIVAVHEVGEQEGQHFFAMDLVRGANLAEVTREGPLPPRQAAELVKKVAEAVRHAHEQGVLHRDLKPSNVLLDVQGEPHVTDFGLARPMDDESSLTLTGQILGTPGYIAPEQAKGGGTVGPAADIYGLGALLFHLLTARAPFVGASTAETLTQVLQQEPLSPRLLNPAVPVDLAAVCGKCLGKLPRDRYGSAGELAVDLERYLRNEPTLARPAGAIERAVRWCRRKPALAATAIALILVGAIGLAGILVEWRRAEAESLNFQIRSYVADMELANRALEGGDLGTAQGLLRRYWPAEHETDLRNWEWRYLANLSQGDPHVSLMAHSTPVLSLRFLDDNALVTAGVADWRTVLWNVKDRRPAITITNGYDGGGASETMAVAPGRNAMFYRPLWHGSARIAVVDFQKGTEDALRDAEGVPLNVRAGVKSLDVSPDQRLLAVAYTNKVGLWDLDRTNWWQSFETEVSPATQGLFSPDGRMLIVAEKGGRITFWNLAEHRKLGVLTVTHDPDRPVPLRFSTDGRWLVNPGVKRPTQVFDVQDRTLVTNLTDSAVVERAVFSADGHWLATAGGDATVRLWETSGWQKTRTFHGHTDPIAAVDFSPNSRFLASGARNGEVKLWSLDEPPTAPVRVSFPASIHFRLAGDASGFGRILTQVSSNGVELWTAEAWSTVPLQRTFTTPLPAAQPYEGVVLAGGRGVVLGGLDGSLRAVGPLIGQEIVVTNAHKGEVYLMDASLDGSTLVTTGLIDGGRDTEGWLRIWRLPRLELIGELPHFENVHGIKLSNDGKLLAAFTGPGEMGVWEIPSLKGPPMWTGIVPLQVVDVCAFSPDNHWLAAATPDGSAFLWNLATHRRTVLPRALTAYNSLSFSPDSSRLAAGSEGESKLFDTASGQTVLSLRFPGLSPRLSLAFTRDGEALLAVHREGASVLHAPSLQELQFDWLKQEPSGAAPASYSPGLDTYVRPDRPKRAHEN